MNRSYKFEVEDIKRVDLERYPNDEFCVARLGYLSSRPNSHKLMITPRVLRESAPSVLGKFLVADMTQKTDATTHTDKETIQGYIPIDQEVKFTEDEDGYLRAYVDAVVSKYYAKDFVNMFENYNNRAVSVEMMVETPDEDEHKVNAFNIVGVTVLGLSTRPSCPQSDITFTRFSESEAEKFYAQAHTESVRKEEMAKVEENKEMLSEVEEVKEEVEMTETETEELAEETVECAESECECGCDEQIVDYEAKCAELTAEIESRDNIIMEKEGEISKLSAENAELKQFKDAVELERKTVAVNTLLAEVKGCFDEAKLAEFQTSGMACTDIDAWSNSVKAFAYEASKSKKTVKSDDGVMSFAAPHEIVAKKAKGLWD